MEKEKKPRKIIILFTSNVQVVAVVQPGGSRDAKWNRNQEFLPTFPMFHIRLLTSRRETLISAGHDMSGQSILLTRLASST